MRVIVTGFDPFGGKEISPAFEAVKRLLAETAGAEIIEVKVPTIFGTSGEKMAEAVETHQPDMVIRVEQADNRQTVTVEKIAINLAEARIPDNAGQQPGGVPLVEDGATAYFIDLPVKAMTKNCHGHQLPAAVSYTAGTFVCNDIMCHLPRLINTKYPTIHDGLIHIPFLPEQTIDKPAFTSMSLEAITDSLFYMIGAAVKTQGGIQLQGSTTH